MKQRSELVFDLRSMGLLQKPGEWDRVEITAPAPEDLRIEVIGVAEGTPMDLKLMFESVVEGIYVSGTVSATATGQDVRTLEELELPITVDINELYLYTPEPGDEESYVIDHGRLDLEPAIRDAVVMALPFSPVKDPDTDGDFHYTVGEPAEDVVEDTADPRWSALKSLLETKKES